MYLDSIQAPSSNYQYIISLLQNIILTSDFEKLPSLIGIEEIVLNKYLDVYDTEIERSNQENLDLEKSMKETWNYLFEQLTLLTEDFEQESIEILISSLTTLYSLLSTPDELIATQYEVVTNFSSLYNAYFQALNLYNNLQDSTDSTFIDLYENTSSSWPAIISIFIVRDKNNGSGFSELIDTWLSDILHMNSSIISRYEYILYTNLQNSLVSINTIISKSSRTSEKTKHLKTLDGSFGSTVGKITNYMYLSELYESYAVVENQVYQAQYTDYQIYSANMLSELRNAISGAKEKEKLQLLFANGYFNIDRSLLIPQLITVYDSLSSDSVVKNSTIPMAGLMKTYQINKLKIGDV